MSLSIYSTTTIKNGNKMPVLGFGTYCIEGNDVENSIVTALNAGYRHIDTAYFYDNEEEIGEVLEKVFNNDESLNLNEEIKRSDLFITSKLWLNSMSYKGCKKSFNKQLKSLKLDYLDLYLLHFPGCSSSNNVKKNRTARLNAWKALEEFYEEGKVKSIGVSNFLVNHLEEMRNYLDEDMELSNNNNREFEIDDDFHIKYFPHVNQVECHPLLTQEDLFNYCKENQIIFQSYSPLAKGELINDDQISEFANKYSKSSAQVLIRWSLQRGSVCLVKSSNPNRINSNADIYDFTISDEDMDAITDLNKNWHCTWSSDHIM
eukprot:TRINITY_DN1775_c0_g1_i1.p1 TRINITY_DN1775_c0_g1~~TRINITY_DN1775_c0_g1_i1.p1  ORF type:complete len:318 (+),score=92.31 TRINITY_DN1775_c0_g1_i1:85-1038(+)